MVAGFVKQFNVAFDYALYDISYANVILYSAVIPTYKSTNKEDDKGEVINADDPANRQKLMDIFNTSK
jgi:hypothetical protein